MNELPNSTPDSKWDKAKVTACKAGRYLRDEFGTQPIYLGTTLSRRNWIALALSPVIMGVAGFAAGRLTASTPEAPKVAKIQDPVPSDIAEAPSVFKPATNIHGLAEFDGINSRMAVAGRKTMPVSENLYDAFIDGGAGGFAITTTQRAYPLIRAIEYGPESTKNIIDAARKVGTYAKPRHIATLNEYDYTKHYASQTPEMRAKLLEAFADGTIDGLSQLFDPNTVYGFIIEAGHQSNAPMDKVDAARESRKKRGINTELIATMDNGSEGPLGESSSKMLSERELNFYLSKLIAIKTIERTKWFPVLNCREGGFLADRFLSLTDETPAYIGQMDSILMMKYKEEERLMKSLIEHGMGGFRIAVHFNDARYIGGFLKNGIIIPQNAHFRDESSQMAEAQALYIGRAARKVKPDYDCKVDKTPNDCDKFPLWSIDSYNQDDPQLIMNGKYEQVKGATPKLFAGIRYEGLTGKRPSISFEPC